MANSIQCCSRLVGGNLRIRSARPPPQQSPAPGSLAVRHAECIAFRAAELIRDFVRLQVLESTCSVADNVTPHRAVLEPADQQAIHSPRTGLKRSTQRIRPLKQSSLRNENQTSTDNSFTDV
jgi:hypothetical protein